MLISTLNLRQLTSSLGKGKIITSQYMVSFYLTEDCKFFYKMRGTTHNLWLILICRTRILTWKSSSKLSRFRYVWGISWLSKFLIGLSWNFTISFVEGLHQRVNVTVIAATNRPDKIDPALLRPGEIRHSSFYVEFCCYYQFFAWNLLELIKDSAIFVRAFW